MPSGNNCSSMTPWEEIPIFVINLSARSDRRDHVNRESVKHGLSIHFVEAVESNNMEQADLGLLTAPALACWKSHLRVFQLILDSNFPFAIVLEDDFEFINSRSLKRKLSKIDLSNWDLVQIGFLTHDFKDWVSIKLQNLESFFFFAISRLLSRASFNSTALGNRLRVRRAMGVPFDYIPDDLRAGAHAYIISRDCARTLVRFHASQRLLTADGLLIALNWTKQFRISRLRKSLVRQFESPSSIKGVK